MKIEFDPKKSEKNERERELPFSAAKDFDFTTAYLEDDDRRDYNETRIIAYGYIGVRLHILCFKPLGPNRIRIISLRKANKRERRKYEKETQAAKRQTIPLH